MNFTLLITLVGNDSPTLPIQVSEIQEQHYIFAPYYALENLTSCDVYTFQVISVVEGWIDGPSEIITATIPSLPLAPVIVYVQSFVKTDGLLEIQVTINVSINYRYI